MLFLEIYIEEKFLGNQTLTYHDNGFVVQKGMRVSVRVQGRPLTGFVKRVYEPVSLAFEVMGIEGVIDTVPVINEELEALAQWISYQTITPIIRCYQTILPNKKGFTVFFLKRTP